jgi:hypothetical protein
MQMLDEQVAAARRVSQQVAHLLQRGRFDLPAFSLAAFAAQRTFATRFVR